MDTMKEGSKKIIDFKSITNRCSIFVFFTFFFFFSLTFSSLFADEVNSKAKENDKSQSDQKNKIPTVITSDRMDMDMKKKLIILTGDVVVEEPTTTIYCDKAYVYLKKDNDKNKKNVKQNNEKQSDGLDSAGDQQVDKVIGVGHVVIIKKQHKDKDGKVKPVQKAVGGKAVYDTKLGTIVLTKEPKLIQGESYVSGTRIIFWKDSDRLKVEGSKTTGAQRSRLIFTPNDEAQMNSND